MAKKNLLHTIQKIFIIAPLSPQLLAFCSQHNCILIDSNNYTSDDKITAALSLSYANDICIIQNNTIIIKPLQLFTKKKKNLLCSVDTEYSHAKEIAKQLKLKICIPLSFNSSVLYIHRPYYNLFMSHIALLALTIKFDFEFYAQFVLNNYSHRISISHSFVHSRSWIGAFDFWAALFSPSDIRFITFEKDKL